MAPQTPPDYMVELVPKGLVEAVELYALLTKAQPRAGVRKMIVRDNTVHIVLQCGHAISLDRSSFFRAIHEI